MSYSPIPQRSFQIMATTGNTYTVPDLITMYIINSATALLALAIVLPPNPTDGMPLSLYSPKGIVALTLTANTGQSLAVSNINAATANTPIRLKYSAINSTWYPN